MQTRRGLREIRRKTHILVAIGVIISSLSELSESQNTPSSFLHSRGGVRGSRREGGVSRNFRGEKFPRIASEKVAAGAIEQWNIALDALHTRPSDHSKLAHRNKRGVIVPASRARLADDAHRQRRFPSTSAFSREMEMSAIKEYGQHAIDAAIAGVRLDLSTSLISRPILFRHPRGFPGPTLASRDVFVLRRNARRGIPSRRPAGTLFSGRQK